VAMKFFSSPILGSHRVLVLLGSLLIAYGCGGDTSTTPVTPGTLPLERYDVGFFSIQKPKGWTVTIAGHCGTLAFLIRDPQNPLRQIFYFGSVGPIYMSQAQKDLDAWYMSQGGYPIPWADAPVVDPFTPANFLAHWPEIADMDAAAAFMSNFPQLDTLHLVANASQAAMLPNGTTGNARGLFAQDRSVGEGMFLVTVVPFMPYNGNPGGGNGYGYFVCGVSAPKGEFPDIAARLIQSLESFTITQSYVDNCIAEQAKIWGAVAEAGRTLSEASDIIWEGWQSRRHTEDISAEKWTDTYRGVERVYDPGTGEVYEVPAGWYEAYDLHRGDYDMNALAPLPDDAWDLWMRAVLDGSARIH
jgi:hypothetical protein